MPLKTVSEELKLGRRALDGIPEVKILQDWQFDYELKKWYIKINITSEIHGIIPTNSIWYVVVEENYPEGTIKVYPDALTGFKLTFEHQSNNGEKEENGLWRKGSLCLDSQLNSLGKYNTESEPLSVDERLFWHVQRSVYWINDANNDKLALNGQPFELPQFNDKPPYFIFSEDKNTFREWENVGIEFGIVKLNLYKSDIFHYYFCREFKTITGRTIHKVDWGEYLSKRFENATLGMWVFLREVPVINKWQAPNSLIELIDACNQQKIDLCSIIQRIVKKNSHIMRDGEQHLLVLGFPVPEKIGGKNFIIHWQALKLPGLSQPNENGTIDGFRDPERLLWKLDEHRKLTNLKLDWLYSQNWSLEKITNRGRLNDSMTSMKTLIIGSGTIGASVAELLVRAGVTRITIMDNDLLEIGNLSRHTLGLNQIEKFKAMETAIHLNQTNPHAIAKDIKENFKFSKDIFEKIKEYDLIIDCTGENFVLDELEKCKFEEEKTFISISISFGARMLFLAMQKSKQCKFDDFYKKTDQWIKKELDEFPDIHLPRDGTKCWSPIFPARWDDILIASSTAVKLVENFIEKDNKELNAVYKKYSENEIFMGYIKIE